MDEQTYKALPIGERLELALSEDLPRAVRPFMVREQWMHVKCYFARRMDLTGAEVAALLEDDDYVIRLCIAKREDLTPEQIERCVSDREPNVRYAVARNRRLADEQRARLLQDEDPLVRRAAQKGPRAVRTRRRPGQVEVIR
ncbi:hypothetical protein HUS23_07605 [Ectothiorhodospiraceae bacterium 2226]|nr:hypothetical protein HUS23_07605 [Ectothiorhodospiraceae bacterium 2226]